MAVYESDHNVPKLSQDLLNTLNLGPGDLRGFFSRAELESFFPPELENIVGIRFYDLRTRDNNFRLLAARVDEDGRQHGNNLISNETNTPEVSNAATVPGNSMIFPLGITYNLDGGTRFTSYFSKSMIMDLVANDSFNGICFYQVSRSNIPEDSIPENLSIAGARTHLAIPTNIANGSIVGITSNPNIENRISDLPCPGHCARLDENGFSVAGTHTDNGVLRDIHYIPSW